MKIQGKYNEAVIYTNLIDNEALSQIYAMLNIPSFQDTTIRIMPDVHVGKGSVVGFTMTLNEYISPNVIGVDIGCGVLACNLGKVDIDLADFDRFIHNNIPGGRSVHENVHEYAEVTDSLRELVHKVAVKEAGRIYCSIGTLGGGNHFLELDVSDNGDVWIVIHSGSRLLGQKVFDYHRRAAKSYIRKVFKGAGAYHNCEFFPVQEEGQEYIHDMRITQDYAAMNREVMARIIVEDYFKKKMNTCEIVNSVHNYIDFSDNIIRKGAISCHKDEKLIIPLNMRDGVLLCTGKGNPEWNYSAPHGTGRLLSRREAKEVVAYEEFEASMKGIYSSCISKSIIDESPMVYKPAVQIMEAIKDTAEITDVLKPLYNFKSGGE